MSIRPNMTAPYQKKVLARLDAVLDAMSTAEPDDLRNLALAAKCLADIEQGARGGNSDSTSLLEQMMKAAATNAQPNPAETKIPEHLQETQEN